MSFFEVAELNTATPTSTGNQTYTFTGVGPIKGVEFELSYGSVNGTAADHESIGTGATDGTRQWAVARRSEHNVNPADTSSRGVTDGCILLLSPTDGSVLIKAAIVSIVNDDVTVNYSVVDGTARLLRMVAYGGDAMKMRVDNVATSGTQNASVLVTLSAIQQPDLVRCVSNFAASGGDSPSWLVSEGFADGVSQDCLTRGDVDNVSPSQSYAYLDSAKILRKITTGATGVSVEYQDNALGFRLFTRDAAESVNVYYCAWGFSLSSDAKVYLYNSPTAVSATVDDTNPGWEPRFIRRITNEFTATDTLTTAGVGGASGVALIANNSQGTIAGAAQDNTATSNTQSVANTNSAELWFHAGTLSHRATFVSWLSTGVRENFATVDVSAKKWISAAIRKPFPAGSGTLRAAGMFLTGSGTVVRQGSGTLTAGALELDGSGAVVRSGTGALLGAGMELDGSGKVTRVADGELIAAGMFLSGSGEVGGPVQGSGALVAAGMFLSGTGVVIDTDARPVVVSGAGQVRGHRFASRLLASRFTGQVRGHRFKGKVMIGL